jgi:hypothetical protein
MCDFGDHATSAGAGAGAVHSAQFVREVWNDMQ